MDDGERWRSSQPLGQNSFCSFLPPAVHAYPAPEKIMEAFEVLSLVLALWLAAAVYSYRRLRHFSGPWLGSVSKLWMMRSTYGGRMHLDVADVCKKYGTA